MQCDISVRQSLNGLRGGKNENKGFIRLDERTESKEKASMGALIKYKKIYEKIANELPGAMPKGYAATKRYKRKSRLLQGLAGWYMNSEEYKKLCAGQ
jgi:hypothetical protein